MSALIAEIAALIGGDVRGNGEVAITGAQSTTDATSGDLTFAVDEKNLRLLADSKAGAAIIPKSLAESSFASELSIPLILVEDPLQAFCEALQYFRPPRPRSRIGVSPQAFVDPSAVIGSGTNIYPGASIGADVVIGTDCDIHTGASVGAGCRIGDACTLHPHAVLYEGIMLGTRVTIHATAVLGADGFGYQLKGGAFQKIPQLGTVIIEDDVEIGAGATIDRAMIGATKIGRGTKIDNLVMIGHNCELGAHNVFASQVGFAGSVTTGDYVMCAGQVGVADHVHLGAKTTLASKTGVHKDLQGGRAYIGQPAQPERDGIKSLMAVAKLPRTVRRVRQLENQVAELTARLADLDGEQPLAKAG